MDHEVQAHPSIVAELDAWLRELVAVEGSDLHVKVGSPPRIRDGRFLRRLVRDPLSFDETKALAHALIPPDRRARFEECGEVDFAHSVPGLGRFRVNAFRQRGAASMVLRRLRVGGATFEELGLPPVVQQLATESRGLVLVAGPTGSGKTSTLGAMIEHINRSLPVHIVTIEDPLEALHPDQEASVNQREVGQDTESFHSAIRAAMRQDPDVILIGEMRDTETVQAALRAAETGQLVLSTLHTADAAETVNRILAFFPADQHGQVRNNLAGALRGIVCQRLVPAVSGGLVPAVEVLVNTGRVAERIVDPSLTSELPEVIAQGGYYGMQTFDQSLLALVTSGKVSVEEATSVASEPHDFQLMLQQAGLVRAGASH
ncbi:MAG: PilT/PilU family type 4a pilus ATPase [Actinobacteria bacterium]|nr:PilT/PilU family type 4a pilus ATPase [Actinomycetota bacterium]